VAASVTRIPPLDHEFARQRGAARASLTKIEGHSTVLAIFIPAESTVGHLFWRQILKAAKERVVLRNVKLLAQNCDFHQA
jgi:hypothetical protein